MIRYILKRIALLVPILLGVSILIFGVIRLAPGDPAEVMLGPTAAQEDIELLREKLGLNRPIVVQYGIFLKNALHGDLGRSIKTNNPVMEELLQRFPATITLAFSSIILALLVGFPLGMIAALKQNTVWDALSSFLALAGFSIPNFWAGLMLMLLFSIVVPIFPSSGYGTWQHMVLPTVVLAIQTMAVIARMTRSSVLEIIRQDYVRTARAKGVTPRRVLFGHVLRNALVPVVTSAISALPYLYTGSLLLESFFGIPGLGYLGVNAINNSDADVVRAIVVIGAVLFMAANLLCEFVYVLIDPRVKPA